MGQLLPVRENWRFHAYLTTSHGGGQVWGLVVLKIADVDGETVSSISPQM